MGGLVDLLRRIDVLPNDNNLFVIFCRYLTNSTIVSLETDHMKSHAHFYLSATNIFKDIFTKSELIIITMAVINPNILKYVNNKLIKLTDLNKIMNLKYWFDKFVQ